MGAGVGLQGYVLSIGLHLAHDEQPQHDWDLQLSDQLYNILYPPSPLRKHCVVYVLGPV